MSLLRPDGGISWDVLARYFAGEMTPPEAEAFQRSIDQDPERRALVERLRALWIEAGALRQRWDAEAALRRVKEASDDRLRVIRVPGPRAFRWRVVLRAAAAVALVAGGFAAWRLARHRPRIEEPLAEVATRRGQRATVRFPDGTEALLGPASRLRYAGPLGGRPREVELTGEAYFIVVHDRAHPFAVRTALGVARDLGTRFIVRAYPGDSTADVIVAEGGVVLAAVDTVASTARRDSLLLTARDLGHVTSTGRLGAERDVSIERYFDWTEGRLVFQDTPLREAAVRLGRWYDLDVRLLAEGDLGARRLTATFRDEPAAQVLQLVAASLDVRVEQRGRIVTIRSRRAREPDRKE